MAEPLDRYDAELTTPDMVILEMDATDKLDAASQLAERMHAAGRISDLARLLQHVNAREHQLATGLPGGIGLPHARSEFVAGPPSLSASPNMARRSISALPTGPQRWSS